MSWKASAWAKEQRLGSPAAKSILLCLADYADPDKGECWPSQTQLAEDAEVSERTAREWLQRLEDWGLISRARRSRANGARASDMIVLKLGAKVRDGVERCREIRDGTVDPDESLPAEIAGRTNRQQDAEPTGNEPRPTGNHCRASIEEPSIEPPNGTSHQSAQARERGLDDDPKHEAVSVEASNRDDPKKIEAEGWALLKNWPQFDGMPKEPAMRIWRKLGAADRAAARRCFLPWLELLKAQRKAHVPAPSTYLTEKLWQAVADPADAPPGPVVAAPFGKAWGARRLMVMLAGSGPLPQAKGFSAQLIAGGGEAGRREELSRQALYGYPEVSRMHQLAGDGKGWTMKPEAEPCERVLALMAPCRVGSDEYRTWKALHDERGWPWLPDPGRQEWVYFPAGGPAGLEAFQHAVRGNNDDGGERQAAE